MGGLFGGSSKSSSSSSNTSTITDNRAVGGDGAIIIGQNGTFQGTDPGVVRIAEMNAALMREQLITQTDGIKFLAGTSADMINKAGANVTDIYQASGANITKSWAHTIDASESIIDKLTSGAKANADASQVVALAAMNANKSDASGLSDAFKYTAMAAAAVAAIYVFKGK